MQGFQLIMNFLVMPIFFLSGSLFPLKGLPAIMEIVVKIDPMTYGVDGMRYLLVNLTSFGIINDFIILGIITFILLVIGSYLFEKIQV